MRYTYDDFNVMTNMTTYRNESLQSGDTTTWLYDEPTGLLTNKVYADGKGPTYTYTIDGKLATRTWARGITTDYSYDGWGNLTNTVYSDDTPTISLFYDALGRQIEAHDAAGVTTFFYDMYGTLTNEAVRCTRGALAAWQGQETTNMVSRYYDSFGRNTGYAFNGVRQSTLSYDPVTGRLASMLANGSDTPFAWSYLPGSDLKSSLAYPNGLTASWTYDSNNQLLQVCNAFSTNVISQYDYTYDAAGRRTEIARSGSAMSETRNDVYGYNIRNELISAVKSGGALSPTTEYAYQYDDIGNRISSFDLGTNRTYAVNNLNQYTSISNSASFASSAAIFTPQFDDDGNQTLIQTSTGVWSVTYNGENRPVLWERIASDSNTQNSNTQTLVSMSFDRVGRRISYLETFGSVTNSHKVFTYDGYLCIASIEDPTAIHYSLSPIHYFVWDPTEPVATRPLVFYNSNVSLQYYTHDGNKNVSDLTDSTQSPRAHYEYTPFGALLSSSGSSSPLNPFRFSSEYSDDASGLVYYNYRHYNPVIGRWMSRDPLEEQGGANIYLIESFIFSTDFLGTYRIRNNCKSIKVDIEAAFFKISQKIVELLNTAKAPTRATKTQKKDASDNRKSIVREISSIFAVLGIKAGERWRNFDAIKARLSNILAQSQRGKGVSVDCCPDRILGSHPCNMPMNAGSAAAMHKGVLYLCAGAIEDPEKYGGWDCLILHELLHLELPPINSSNFGTRQGMNIEKLNVRLCSYLLGHRCHVEAYGE